MKPNYSTHNLSDTVLRGLCLAVSALTIFLASFNAITNKAYSLTIIEFIFSASSFFLYYYSKDKSFQKWHKRSYIGIIFFMIAYATFTLPLNSGSFFWAFSLPIIYYLILGLKSGLILSIVSLFSILFIAYLNSIQAGIDISKTNYLNQLMNFFFCYTVISVISHAYESNKQSNEKGLYKMAHVDNLTGAFNRRAFNNTISNLVENKSTTFFLLIDIDHFKRINDQYGHDIGDYVLKKTCTIISDIAGPDNVFRYGGEEFCVLLKVKSDEASALRQAEVIRKTIKSAAMIRLDPKRKVTISIGVSKLNPLMDIYNDIKLADVRLYKAKNQGRDQIVFN